MKTYIALLRGINLVGRNRLPMDELKSMLERHGCVDVRTYIQSGNVILKCVEGDAKSLAKRIGGAVSKRHGFKPRVLLTDAKGARESGSGQSVPAS